MGFFASWIQWSHSLAWFPAILAFVGTTLTYVLFPNFSGNKIFFLTVTLVLFWGMTGINYFGIKISTLVSTVGVIAGSLFPGLVIIVLGLIWVLSGNPVQIHFTSSDLVPHFDHIDHLVFFSGLIIAFAGLEVSAGFAGEVKDPKKNYPRSIICASVIAFIFFLCGSLSISYIMPREQISLVGGLMQMYSVLFDQFHMGWLIPVFAILLIIRRSCRNQFLDLWTCKISSYDSHPWKSSPCLANPQQIWDAQEYLASSSHLSHYFCLYHSLYAYYQ